MLLFPPDNLSRIFLQRVEKKRKEIYKTILLQNSGIIKKIIIASGSPDMLKHIGRTETAILHMHQKDIIMKLIFFNYKIPKIY